MNHHSFKDNFILWEQGDEPTYEIIENDNMDELNDMIEEQVEGYEEVNMLEDASENDEAYYIGEDIITEPREIYQIDDQIVNGSTHIGVGMSHLIEQRVQEAENKIIGDRDANEEYSTVEEVITEDWTLEGQEMVQVAMEQVVTSDNFQEDDTETVPLHTDQDEYTTSRPYPCDFCSRRFRKKANLMNHMVAHQNVRPHMCNLCGSRYVRKCDLINHLKIHAYNIEEEQSAGGTSTGGKKKPPRDSTRSFDELDDFFNDTYDDIPDDEDFDYSHYSKSTTLPATSKSKKAPAKKVPAKRTVKFEKHSKDKTLSKDLNMKFKDRSREKKEDLNFNSYVEHFPITDPRKPFVCQHCGVAFTREKALESHMRLHAVNQEPTHDCEVCGDSFYDITALEEHMELRHDYSSRVRRTGGKSTSGKTLPRGRLLESTRMDFDDDSNSEYEPEKNNEDMDDEDEEEELGNSCDKCHMSFKTTEALKRHVKTHFIKSEILSDDGEKTADGTSLGCNVCGESFNDALDLLAHAEIHARFQPFKCQLCGETFFEENKIKIHLMDNHSDELTESSCRLCGKQCRDQRSLIKHSWEHSREKNHPCSKCGKTFHNKARLKRHISSHRNKSVMCEVCHEEFPDGRQLMNHRHSHTKSNQFPCHECGKTFGSRSSQQIHIRIHTGERPYGCRYCWKAFADGGTLRKHERIHTGEKPYCCLVCPRAFNQRVVLREHIRSHHSAPDPVNGTTLTPYYCSLCGDLFTVALDLIQHLIAHSDRSTAAKRVAPVGPRKYKRRRKLNGDSDTSDFVSPEPDHRQAKAIKKEPFDIRELKRNVLYSAFPINNKVSDFELPDEIFQSLGKKVPKIKIEQDHKRVLKIGGTSTRPKMIYTQKTRLAVTGKRKTKTMIQKKIVQSGKTPLRRLLEPPKDLFEHNESSETWSNDDPNEDVLDTLLKRERKLSEKFTIDLVNDLQEILRSPLKNSEEKNVSNGEDSDSEAFAARRSRRNQSFGSRFATQSDQNKVQKFALDEVTVKLENEKDEGMCCVICGESFETRSQLLSHVPIHI